jgi:hypothetical protein
LKPYRPGTALDGVIHHSASTFAGNEEIDNIHALRLGNVEQRCVCSLAMSIFFAGIHWDDNAAVVQKCASDGEGWAVGIAGQADDSPHRPEYRICDRGMAAAAADAGARTFGALALLSPAAS